MESNFTSNNQKNENSKASIHYKPKRCPTCHSYKTPSISTDAAVIRKNEKNELEVLLIRRGHDPFKGYLAFPGGLFFFKKKFFLQKLKRFFMS